MIANPNDGNSPRVEAATPIIDVSAEGLITATTEQEAGYVPGGTKSATKQLTTQAAKTVTPGTAAQTAVASGRYTTGAVTVKGDANLKAENIAEGVSIFGVLGTHSGGGGSIDYFQGEVEPVDMGNGVKIYSITLPIESSKNVFALVSDTDFWDTRPEAGLLGTISFANGETYSTATGNMPPVIIRNSAESVIRGPVNRIGKVKYFVFAVSG